MPWKIAQENGKFQVHKENADGSLGAAVGKPHDTRKEATDHLKALYSNVSDANELAMEFNSIASATIHFEADTQNPRLLHFKDFVLARPETNKNRDGVDEQGIKELANTISGMPIDYNHDGRKNVGFFTAGRVGQDGELRTDGAIWLDRCQDNDVDPQDVLKGIYGMSIEADAATAECSICHKIFASANDYCEHLQVQGNDNGVRSRLKHGSIRFMRGLRALGGAFTKNPAGSNTGSDSLSGIVFAASHQEVSMDDIELNASETVDLWIHNILVAAIEKRKDVSDADKKRAESEYGDVEYADEKNKKYPLDKEHIHAAWSYINMPKNAAKYSSDELATIKNKIKRAAKKFGMEISEDKKKNKENAAMDAEDKNKKSEDGQEPDEDDKDKKDMKANYEAVQKQLTEMAAKLDTANQEKAAAEQKLQAAEQQLVEANKQLEAANNTLKEHRVQSLRATLVGSVMDEAAFESDKDMLLTLPQKAIELMIRKPQEESSKMQAAVENTGDDTPRLY